jgi:hypothetical protein
MKTTWFWTVVLAGSIAGMLLAGCGQAVDTGGTGGMMQDPLVGNWLSQGADVAPLLAGAPFNYTQITADFHADGTYAVVGLDASAKETDFTGTWQAQASSVSGIFSIDLSQTTPSVVQSEGIYRIDTTVTPNRMTYEVVQTQPTNGLAPPTAEAGFGSTVFNGKQIATLIQNYSRQ